MSFDQAFQEQLAAHYIRDDVFVASAGTLVEPDYFEDATLGALVAIQKDYLNRYAACCTPKTFMQLIKAAIASKMVQIPDMDEARRLLKIIFKDQLKDRQYVIDKIADFARHQALSNSTLDMADALDSGDSSKVNDALHKIEQAKEIGAADAKVAHEFSTGRQERAAKRKARLVAGATGGGITTGLPDLDKYLTPWHGWGRKELTILMGPPKAGKTAALVTFGANAASAGFNVFYASCEVSEEILGDRADANISGVPLREFERQEASIDAALEAWEKSGNRGRFDIQSFPIRTLKVSALKRILKKRASQGIDYDMIIVDYGDILKPEVVYSDKRHGLAEIFQDLRAMATEFNAAVLTATQTNREGTKKAARNVTDGTDAAEDYEKVRTADALITINASEEDKEEGEVVLYFSEMRNAESGLRLRFTQDIKCMRFVVDFVRLD